VPPEHPADRNEAHQPHEEIAHPAVGPADIGHLGEDHRKFGHHLSPDALDVGDLRQPAQHLLGQIKALQHRSFHRAAVRLVIGMNLRHGHLLDHATLYHG
jgi:hypothetical protein